MAGDVSRVAREADRVDPWREHEDDPHDDEGARDDADEEANDQRLHRASSVPDEGDVAPPLARPLTTP